MVWPDLELDSVGSGAWERDVGDLWWGHEGQFGGYVNALALAACRAEVADDERAPRALTVHFLRRFPAGRFRAEVSVERSGRSVSNLSVRLSVDGVLCGLGLATFGRPRPVTAFVDGGPPAVEPFDATRSPKESPVKVPAQKNFEFWPVLGGRMFAGTDSARSGGWLRFADRRPFDEEALLLAADIYLPAVYVRLDEPAVGGTMDFTAHFRDQLPHPAIGADDPVLVELTTAKCWGGYVEEDCEIWSPTGDLLFQSRQLRFIQRL
ncbi:MAG: thioesterase family protein [Acidimicrobiales bacterium]|nr:thioesterase family protein [Acidimicrobiales bacterium]